MSFLAELKRRKVIRVAGAYVAGAFIAVQAADVVFPRIPLPDWTVSLVVWLAVLGFPVTVLLAWAFDITPEGVRRTGAATAGEQPSSEPDGARSRAGLLARVAGVVVLLLLMIAAIAYQVMERDSDGSAGSDPRSGDALAILPFEVRGSEQLSYLADGMVDLLATKLSGVDQVRAVDPRALLDYVRRHPGASVGAGAASTARHFSAAYYVLGSVVEFSGRMQLRASLYAQDRPGDAVVEASAEGDDDQLFAMVDDLAGQLLAGLSEGTHGRLTRLAALTTDSISALKHYLAGERAYREARFAESADLFERAVRIDSTFALAAYRLAHAANWASDNDRRSSAIALARRHEQGLAPRERALLEAFDAVFGQDEFARAEHLYRQILARYPDDVDAWYMLGELVLHGGVHLGYTRAEAAEPFARALALAPELAPALYHSANLALAVAPHDTAALASLASRLLALTGDTLLALSDLAYARRDSALQRRVEALMPTAREPVNTYYASLAADYAVRSDRPAARRVLELIARTTPSQPLRALARADLARVEQAWGHFAAAERELKETTRLNEHLGWQERVRLALHPLRASPPGMLRALRDSLGQWNPAAPEPLSDNLMGVRFGHAAGTVRTYLIGALDVRLDTTAARRAARELGGRQGEGEDMMLARDLGALLEAELDRGAGDGASALRQLEGARFWSVNTVGMDRGTLAFVGPVFLRAELLREAGRPEDAARWYRVAADHIYEYRAPAYYRLCQLHEAAGRKAEAAEACGWFLDLWRDAGPELASVVADARNILQRMQPDAAQR